AQILHNMRPHLLTKILKLLSDNHNSDEPGNSHSSAPAQPAGSLFSLLMNTSSKMRRNWISIQSNILDGELSDSCETIACSADQDSTPGEHTMVANSSHGIPIRPRNP